MPTLAPTLSSLQSEINQLTGRVNVIDGNGLPVPNKGQLNIINTRINGVQSDLQSSILMMESIVSNLQTQVNAYINLWLQKFDISVTSPANAPTQLVLADIVTGISYNIVVVNGTLTTTEL